jgi:O-acetyl-ADP-ribose deacetylase (regulator of RNase III)
MLSRVVTKKGDLTDCRYYTLVHQCNTVTTSAKGLSADMFARFPGANTYTQHGFKRVAGTISIHHVGTKQVVNLYGQVFPGRASDRAKDASDCAKDRIEYFRACLAQLASEKDLRSVAFPDHIGCGLAGGHWVTYRQLIEEFAAKVAPVEVVILKK